MDKPPVEQYYDKLASIYDEATSKRGAWTPPAYVAKELAHNETKYNTALIIGVGTGKEIEILREGGISYIEGIDISNNMVAQAYSKFQDVQLHHGDFMKFVGFKLSSYDLIICSGTLEFISDYYGFFVKCSELLSKSGELIVTYEPIIMGHKFQNEAKSEISPEMSKDWGVWGFITYRRNLSDFLKTIDNIGLSLENFIEFVSYRKLETDIIYHFARLKKK